MSTRCRSCNQELLMISRKKTPEAQNEFEDLCGPCRSASYRQYNFVYDHEYVLEEAQDGDVSKNHDCSSY